MNELQAPARFVFWLAAIALAVTGIGYLGPLTYKTAVAAAEAHQKDQMSWGKFSRQLWSTPKKK